ncbi:MAG: phosphatidylserine decarboxylase [Deltaproteobacteria bacterium]|nr:phosphatidylserine decarboxylase [Deltaproteobacteria bacterium]
MNKTKIPEKPGWHGEHVERATGEIGLEPIMGDAWIRRLYEDLPGVSRGALMALTSRLVSRVLAYLAFDAPFTRTDAAGFAEQNGIDLAEAIQPPGGFRTRRDVFLRKLDYERVRPVSGREDAAVCLADAKLICGELGEGTRLPVKNRWFDLETLVGRSSVAREFAGGTFAVFRLAPPDYHWFHAPVSGLVRESYPLAGRYFSVNPRAIRALPHVLSDNARAVAIIDTDIEGGTGIGLVAVIPVAAQVIGKIVWASSERGYDEPKVVAPGLFVQRGRPMGFFAPGSSTVVALFQPGRILSDSDLTALMARDDVPTLYTEDVFGRRAAEVAVRVNESFATRM